LEGKVLFGSVASTATQEVSMSTPRQRIAKTSRFMARPPSGLKAACLLWFWRSENKQGAHFKELKDQQSQQGDGSQ